MIRIKKRIIFSILMVPFLFVGTSCGGWPLYYVRSQLPFDPAECESLILLTAQQSTKSVYYTSICYYTENADTINHCFISIDTIYHAPNNKKNLTLFDIIGKTKNYYSDFRFNLKDGSTYRFVATPEYVFYNDGIIYKYAAPHSGAYESCFYDLPYLYTFEFISSWEC